jgi:hypothetical protein
MARQHQWKHGPGHISDEPIDTMNKIPLVRSKPE